MIDYSHILGGLLTSEFPYIIMIFCGYFLAKYEILHREGVVSLSKLMIDIFIPIYLFINVCRSTSVDIIQNNYIIILSTIFYVVVSGTVALVYSLLTNMDVRYRFTWIFIVCITDIKQVHYMMINSFCYHLTESSTITENETHFCHDALKDNFVHMFFQSLLTWYVASNMIRTDRINAEKVEKVLETAQKREDLGTDNKTDPDKNGDGLKEILEKYSTAQSRATPEFMTEITPLFEDKKAKPKQTLNEFLFVIFRPPLIGMFTGFVVGFIPSIQEWIFTKTTVVYVSKYFFTINSYFLTHLILLPIVI
jgi:predicted permease